MVKVVGPGRGGSAEFAAPDVIDTLVANVEGHVEE